MTGDRYRLVTVQGGEAHVSTLILGESEVAEHLDLEESLHDATGWAVARMDTVGERFPQLFCLRGLRARRIFVKRFTPMDDSPQVAGGQ